MSLQPKLCYEAPEETARIARSALPQGTLCIRSYDALGTIFQDADFVSIRYLAWRQGWRGPSL
jgi:hypothetical protein